MLFLYSLTILFTYFIMMGVITLFSKYRERNIFMLALEKDKAGLVSYHILQNELYLVEIASSL